MKLMSRFLPLIIIAIVATAVLTYLPLKQTIAYKLGLSGDPTTSCCSEDEVLKSPGSFDETASAAIFNNKAVDYPKTSLAQSTADPADLNQDEKVLGTKNAAGEEKWIEVSLDQQKLRAWEGNKIVMEFPISSGLWYPTPKGDFNIWYKTRSQRMVGGSKAIGTFYDLPNVPYNMFFYKGFGIHGTYWHNNFGHPMSHGCVNAPIPNAQQLFEWTGPVVPADKSFVRATDDNPGTRVFVH